MPPVKMSTPIHYSEPAIASCDARLTELCCYSIRYQSAMFHSSESHAFMRIPPSELA